MLQNLIIGFYRMNKKVSATEAVRNFSEILNSIKYQGNEYTIVRGGKPVAQLSPIESIPRHRFLGELRELLRYAPKLGKEAKAFKKDMQEVIRHQPPLPSRRRWV